MKIRTSHVPASALMEEDRFKMAGQMYRVMNVTTNAYDQKVIRFYSVFNHRGDVATMIVPRRTMFKVYNRR